MDHGFIVLNLPPAITSMQDLRIYDNEAMGVYSTDDEAAKWVHCSDLRELIQFQSMIVSPQFTTTKLLLQQFGILIYFGWATDLLQDTNV